MADQNKPPTPTGEGAAFPWILEHILAYPGSYEIPLRSMYTLNSAPRAQKLSQPSPRQSTMTTSSANPSPTSANFPIEDQQQLAIHAATTQFKANLMSQISQLPSQPCSLPPSFVTSFVRRCFTPELEKVDFPQALTGLDYLKDLENRRRKEVEAVLRRLGLTKETPAWEREELAHKYPGIDAWLKAITEKERHVEALYTQVYLGLRRWTLINEMSLLPFNKANCIAMLNTLYPPVTPVQPTSHLTPTVLNGQRNGFFRYIQSVEMNGIDILDNIIMQGKRPGDENGWTVVRDTVDKYLRAANGIIEECFDISGRDSLDPNSTEQIRKGRKVDSGISFATGDRPSTSSSGSSKRDKPLPSFPETPEPKLPKQGGSTLEKIAREIRKMRSRSDIRTEGKKEPKEKSGRSLKKMKSASALAERDRNLGSISSDGSGQPAWDAEEFKRNRLLWEGKHHRKVGSNEL